MTHGTSGEPISMASPLFDLCNDALSVSLSQLAHARLDAASFVPETGLLVLHLYKERKILLGVGIGPIVSGVALLAKPPRASADRQHQLLAALRAHLIGAHLRNLEFEDNSLWIIVERPNLHPIRLVLYPDRQGSARLLIGATTIVTWPPNHEFLGPPTNPPRRVGFFETDGEKLLGASDVHVLTKHRRELAGIIRQKYKKLERRMQAVTQDLQRLDDVPRLQKIGSLLLAQGQTITRGTFRAELFDWSTNEKIVVELAPDKPVKDQAQQLFQKARRLQRGADVMKKRLADTQVAMHSLEALEKALQDVPEDWDALQKFALHMHAQGLAVQAIAPVSSAKRHVPDARRPYHCFSGANGATIWVGRSSRDNDELVTRLAKPHDLWLHAKNMRGAHVIVPLEKNHSCPSELLVDAATLAAHFSDARNESICDVSYVERRYVRKPKKSLPGLVTTQREKVIAVRIEKDRLARLLSSKVET